MSWQWVDLFPDVKLQNVHVQNFLLGENIGEIVFFGGSDILLAVLIAVCEVSDGVFSIHRETLLSCQGGLRWKRRKDVVPRITTKVSRLSGAPGTLRPAASASLACRDVRRTERSLLQSLTPAVRRCKQHLQAPPPFLRSSHPLGVRRSHAVGGACIGSAGRHVAIQLHAPGRRPHLPSSGHPDRG